MISLLTDIVAIKVKTILIKIKGQRVVPQDHFKLLSILIAKNKIKIALYTIMANLIELGIKSA